MNCNHYPSLPVPIHSKTFRKFCVFVFRYRAIIEDAELAENKIGVTFDWRNPWRGIRVSWEIILRIFYQWRNIIIFHRFHQFREFRGIDLALFKLENKKELHGEINKSRWSPVRGFNWQHSKSYIMPQPTDCQIQYVTSLSLQFLANIYWGNIYLQMIFQWSKGIVSPHKVWRDLFLKTFHGKWGTNYWGSVLNGKSMIRSCQRQGGGEGGRGEFHKYIFQ